MVLNSLGGVLVKLKGRARLEEAEQLFRRSLEMRPSFGDRHGEAMVLNSLGSLLVDLGGGVHLEEAERLYRRSLEIGEQLGLRRHQAMVLQGFVRLAEAKGDIEQACQYLEKIISIDESLGNHRFVDKNRRRLEELRRKISDE